MRGQSMYPEKYLSENASVLDINDNDDFSSLAMLDSVQDQYRVFLTGEAHYLEGNFEVKWKMLRYMHGRAGIKNLVLESSPSFGWLLTHYLRERDEDNYRQIVSMSPQGAKERVFYNSIYKYFSETLPDDSLRIIGIDGEFVSYLTVRALDEMAEKGNRRLKNASKVPVDLVLFNPDFSVEL